MNNWLIMPIILPLFAGMGNILIRKRIRILRITSIATLLALLPIAILLLVQVDNSGIQVLYLGGWEAPFGITLVCDLFSALLLAVTAFVAFCVLIFAVNTIGEEREGNYFYPLFLFLIAGVNGSFLTGDLFNLYVFFEVLLLASYVLASLGGEGAQLRESMKYIVINVLSSTFFLLAIGYLYSVTGTLNLAHLSVRVGEAGQDGLLTAIGILFLFVFSIKAGLFLFYWLPGSYSAPPPAIRGIFAALLTKVGIYAMIRLFTLVFYHHPEITHHLIGILAAITLLLGGLGAIAYWDIQKVVTYNVIIGSAFVLAGLAAFNTSGLTGSLYYIFHDMLIKALLFLIAGVILQLSGTSDLRQMSGLIRIQPVLGWIFFLTALSLVGIPPLSGFLGKVFITQGTFEGGLIGLGVIGLFSSLLVLVSMMKIFLNAFWGETVLRKVEGKKSIKGVLLPIILLAAAMIAYGLGPEGYHHYIGQAVADLLHPDFYIRAVMENVIQ